MAASFLKKSNGDWIYRKPVYAMAVRQPNGKSFILKVALLRLLHVSHVSVENTNAKCS